jgi:hypothetical protein
MLKKPSVAGPNYVGYGKFRHTHITIQKWQRVRLVPHMHNEGIQYVTDTKSIASFLTDF